jgi:hypothetical protein
MGFWQRSRLIFHSFRHNANASMRQVARHTGLSKSRVHRLEQAMERRKCHPESCLWETEEGHRWLLRLVVAVLSHFGLKRGGGAETMHAFFACLHLEQQVGCAPSTLRAVMAQLEHLILETTAALEREGIAQGQMGPMVGAVDATFLERMMVVCMDLVRGSILFEAVADDRTSEPWHGRVKARLDPLKPRVLSLVSDRAQALITLAETGLACPSIPEVFPLLDELGKGYALAISSQWKAAHQALSQVQAHLDQLPASGTSETEAQAAQSAVAACEAEGSHGAQVREASRAHLKAMSLPVFPWRVTDSTPQTSQEVAVHLTAEVAAIQALLETNGVPVKQQVLGKVRPQLAGVAGVIDLWWQELRQDVQSQRVLTPMWAHWVEAHLLPFMYWEQQGLRTRCPRRKAKL